MSAAQFEFTRDMMLANLLANRRYGKRQVQLDYKHLLRRLVRGSDISRSVEIGAFDAEFSRWFIATYPDLPAIAYEANPYVAQEFSDRCTRAGVDYRHACVAETSGIVDLSIPLDFRGSPRDRVNQMASLLSNKMSDEGKIVSVPSIRLDEDIALAPDDRIVMWVDVEGALGRVLPYATKVLSRTVLMNVEVEQRAIWDGQWLDTDVADFIEAQGFILLARDNQAPFQYNCLFANAALFDMGAARPMLKVFHSGSFPKIEVMLDRETRLQGGAQ